MKKEILKNEVKINLVKLEKTRVTKKEMTHVIGGCCMCMGPNAMRPVAGVVL